jgi:rhodanese-related sulfurtransferase
VDATELAKELAESAVDRPVVLDVRGPRERERKRIAVSVHLPLNHLEERLAEVPRGAKIVVHCAGGYRSSIAASLLERGGVDEVRELAGGLAAWEAAKLELEGENRK